MNPDLLRYPHPDRALLWHQDHLWLLDQRTLPQTPSYIAYAEAPAVALAIRDMVVRGAPAIGVTAAYGVVLAARQAWRHEGNAWRAAIDDDLDLLARARPTAVNLAWALRRMVRRMDALPADADPEPALLAEAQAIHEADRAANRRLGDLGAALIIGPTGVLTHCNAGALATGGYGTALGVIRSGHAQGRIGEVFADETRPWLQGARLTAWELLQNDIPVTLVAEGAAASLLARGGIGWVIVGADRVAANGDTANKIGTYGLAILARQHGVRFMVAAPTATIDPDCPNGSAIPIEERDPAELLACGGCPVAAPGAGAWNPVFDVTPAGLVDALVTEKGVVERPDREKIHRLLTA